MNNFSTNTPNVTSNLNNPEQLQPSVNNSNNPQTKHSKIPTILVGIFLLVIGIAIGWFGYKYNTIRSNTITLQTPTPSPILEDGQQIRFTSDPENKIIYTLTPSETISGYETVILLPDGSNKQKLAIPNVSSILKRPNLNQIVYTDVENTSEVFFHDLTTNKTISWSPFEDEKIEGVNTTIGIYDENTISPDGSYIILYFYQEKPCTSQEKINRQGHGGPCLEEFTPILPSGYYLYEIASKTKTFLSKEFVYTYTPIWDMKNKILFYNNSGLENGGLYSINLQSKEITLISPSSEISLTGYPLLNTNKVVYYEAKGENPNYSKISVKNSDSTDMIEVDTSVYASIQPFILISPDEKYIVYQKNAQTINGRQFNNLYKYNLTTNTKTQLTASTNSTSYTAKGIWINNKTLITLVDTIELENYNNNNNYLVSIDVENGIIKRLTPENTVNTF